MENTKDTDKKDMYEKFMANIAKKKKRVEELKRKFLGKQHDKKDDDK